jgi:hypothetical protein
MRLELQKSEAVIRDGVAKMKVELQGADLNEVPLRELDETDAHAGAQLKLLVKEKGASVQASNALHCCAAHHTPEHFLHLLLEHAPEQEKVKTVISMCAAARGMEGGKTCEKLFNLGANKFIADLSGRSALGCFRLSTGGRLWTL